jgi:hypothetical protein
MKQQILAALEVFKGLLTPLIAIVTAYIAWQQWKANERRLILDRYDRRLKIYQRVIEFIALSCRDFQPKPHEVIAFRGATAEADFLFGPEIGAYIQELSKGRWRPEQRTLSIATTRSPFRTATITTK